MSITEAHRATGIQSYWFARKLEAIREMNATGPTVINLGIGSPDLPPPPAAIAALQAAAARPEVHGYQNYRGIPELREAIADWCARIYQTDPDPNSEILPLIGSKEGIQHISMAFVNPGDRVLVPNPGYPAYRAVTELVGGQIEEYRVDEAGIDALLAEPGLTSGTVQPPKIVWLNFPHMPTGRRPNRAALTRLIDRAGKLGVLLVNDNPYSTLLTEDYFSIFQLKGAREVCLELNSLSKSHNMAGWRIGWLSGKKELVDAVLKVKTQMDSGMFKPLQLAAAVALQQERDWIDRLNWKYRVRRTHGVEILETLGCQPEADRVGLFLWARIPESAPSALDYSDQILHQHRVFITPGTIFGSEGDRYLRLSLCSPIPQLEQSLSRIKSQFQPI